MASADILDTFYQFTPAEIKTLYDYIAWQSNSDASANVVLAVALKIDAFMQTFYHRAAQMAPSEPIRDLFENLAEAVKAKQQDQASSASFLEDI